MKKFLLGLLVGSVLAALTVVIVALSIARLGESRPSVPETATLVIRLAGDIPEKAPVSFPIPWLGAPAPLTVHEIWSTLQRASSDPKIKAVVLQVGRVGAGWAKMQEIRHDILEFRKSGKPVYAYLESPSLREYYVATAADRIYTIPEDIVDVKGLRAQVMYYRKVLEKLGVEVNVQHVGRFKDAGDQFTETSMSPETRESLGLLLDGIWNHVLESVAAGRNKPVDEIRSIIDEGPFTARQAAAKGLIDSLRYEDQVFGELKEKLGQKELKKISIRDYIRANAGRGTGDKVALVVGSGTILRGAGIDAMGTDEGFTSGAFIRMLRRVADDKSVKGVILRIDSPGGDAFASDEILREVLLLRQKKPIVISMSDAAASGGYYVSMTGDPILAYPTTITGSIGVLFTTVNIKGLLDKAGVNREILTRGRNADLGDIYSPPRPEARAKIQAGLDEFYTQFVSKVAAARNREYNQVEPLAQGRVWLGQHAKERGLVDTLGGLDTAVAEIRKRAKLSEKLDIVPYPQRRTWLEQLMRSTSDQNVMESKLISMLGFDYRVWQGSGYMRMLPFQLSFD